MMDSNLPHRFIPVGGEFESRGMRVTVVERPARLDASEACSGCVFNTMLCPRVQCSKWDRADGKNVWYKEVK